MKLVFFDVMGLMMVVYSERLGVVVNLITAAVVLLTVYLGTGPGSNKKLSGTCMCTCKCIYVYCEGMSGGITVFIHLNGRPCSASFHCIHIYSLH